MTKGETLEEYIEHRKKADPEFAKGFDAGYQKFREEMEVQVNEIARTVEVVKKPLLEVRGEEFEHVAEYPFAGRYQSLTAQHKGKFELKLLMDDNTELHVYVDQRKWMGKKLEVDLVVREVE